MNARGAGELGLSRRSFLAASGLLTAAIPVLSLNAAGNGRGTELSFQPEFYPDVATENPVLRLTDPVFMSLLPGGGCVGRRGDFLLIASDVSGSLQAHRMELPKPQKSKGAKTGTDGAKAEPAIPSIGIRQWTDVAGLNASSLIVFPGDRSFAYADSRGIWNVGFSGVSPILLHSFAGGFGSRRGISVSADAAYLAFAETRPGGGAAMRSRLRLLHLRASSVIESKVLVEADAASPDDAISDPAVRPRRASVLYRRNGGVYLANLDGSQNYRLKLAEGVVRATEWSPDGRSVLYLLAPVDQEKPVAIREFVPDTNQDRLVANTTRFAGFSANADGSVLAGAGASKASPYVMLLVRAVGRELALCEHRASDPAMVNPVFSPNSQQVFFTSDLHGKPAVYQMDVRQLVAETKADGDGPAGGRGGK